MGDLDGRVALITGAGRGQGRSHAVALAAAGADIVACDVPGPVAAAAYRLSDRNDLDRTAELVEKAGGRCLPLEVDVRDAAAVEDAVSSGAERFGSIDIAIANAGIVSTGPLDEVTDEVWRDLIDINLSGVFHTIRAVIPGMRRRLWGRIVVTSSMGGRIGIPGLSAYSATKWGIIGLAKCVALEVARDGITVNVVAPCTTRTPMVQPDDSSEPPDELVRRMARGNPIPKPWIEPDDVTRAVMYLVSDPGVVTGTVMEVALGGSARTH